MARRVRTVSFSLPVEIVEMLEAGAAASRISKSSYVSMLLAALLEQPIVAEEKPVELLQKAGE